MLKIHRLPAPVVDNDPIEGRIMTTPMRLRLRLRLCPKRDGKRTEKGRNLLA